MVKCLSVSRPGENVEIVRNEKREEEEENQRRRRKKRRTGRGKFNLCLFLPVSSFRYSFFFLICCNSLSSFLFNENYTMELKSVFVFVRVRCLQTPHSC